MRLQRQARRRSRLGLQPTSKHRAGTAFGRPAVLGRGGSVQRADCGLSLCPMTDIDRDAERSILEAAATDSWYAIGANAVSTSYCAEVFSRSWRGDSCLELGPGEGLITKRIVADFSDVTLVDGSKTFCTGLRQHFPTIRVECVLFEDFEPKRSFDTIVLGHVLEHVADPVRVLRLCREWLAPRGRLFAGVPNARSLHRQAAVIMGLLESEAALNDADRHHGHRRVYDPERFRADFLQAGWTIEVFGGYWVKPVSNDQIAKSWTPEMLRAFMALGERYPDIAAEIYVIARP